MYSIPSWTEENRALHDVICQARVSAQAANELQQQLQLNKQRFLSLLDSEPKNRSHRELLNSNQIYINRNLHTVSKDFATKVLFLSDQLNINECVAATLLMRGTTESTRVGSNAVDTAVLLYHGERGYLLACLDVVLKSAKDASISEEVRSVCYQFMGELMDQNISLDNNTYGTFVTKIISTLEYLSKTINAIRNTGSVNGELPQPGSGKLGEDISDLRIERLGDERIYVVQILYHIASLFRIETNDKLSMLKLLEDAELSDPATSYVITAMIATLVHENQTDEKTPSASTMQFINAFHNRIMNHGSKIPVIKAVVVLQWILYLSDPVRVNVVISDDFVNRNDVQIQQLLEMAVESDVFRFMDHYLLYFQQPNATIDTERKMVKYNYMKDSDPTSFDKFNYRNFNADIRIDFQPFVIHELEKLATTMIDVKFGYIQQLKYREEDTNTPLPVEATKQCHDLEYFLAFIASIYRNRVNAGTLFWDRDQHGFNNFTRWIVSIKVITTVCSAFDFLASISTGDECASQMYKFFMIGVEPEIGASPLFSWGKPFSALEFYANLLKDTSEERQAAIPVIEEQLLLKFLCILKQTVQYSKEARIFFWLKNVLRAQDILCNFLVLSNSTHLRAALFDVIAAFCSGWGGGTDGIGSMISLNVWKFLEKSDALIPKYKTVQIDKERSHQVYKPSAIMQEFEVEKTSRVYTQTLSVIRLIGSAIHTQSKREALVNGFKRPASSIPVNLGKGTNHPGAIPFISFVVDDIFVTLPKLKYTYAEARWQLTESCLMVMENSIESFDLEAFEREDVKAKLNENLHMVIANEELEKEMLGYLIHPGFQVIIRILSGGRVVDEIFTVIEECAKKKVEEVEKMPYHQQCLVRALRIVRRVLSLHNTFCKVLIPYIMAFSKKNASSEFELGGFTFAPLPSVVFLGQLLLFRSEIIERIALLVNYEDQEEICFLSTKILNYLTVDKKDAESRPFGYVTPLVNIPSLGTSITTILSTCTSVESIIFGASERLSINLPEVTTCDDYEYDINNIPFWLAKETLENTYSYPSDFQPRISSSVRLAILDLLLDNAKQKISPTLTEFLLGYDLSKKHSLNKIQDTEANKSMLVCFHTILDMMRQGVERNSYLTDVMTEDNAETSLPLIDTHPILAEKCYELIYRLCAKKSLSISTLRYLRNRENFFYRQFDAISSRIEHNIYVESPNFPGNMICADGTQIKTDFFKLKSKLHQRAWILQCVALELHTTVTMGQTNEANKLLELLYGRKSILAEDDMDTSRESNVFSASHSFQQSLVKMLELVSSLEFTWVDHLKNNIKVTELFYFSGFDVNAYLIQNDRGCEIYDVREMYTYLRNRQQTEFSNTPDNDAVETEMGSILNWSMSENHTREITQGKLHCLEAWKDVIQITLNECFDLIGLEHREHLLYELLNMLLTKLMNTKEYNGTMRKSMSEVIVTLITRLRKDTAARPASQLPIEKIKLIFSCILDCISQEKATFEVRGDLYTCITGLLLYMSGHDTDDTSTQFETYIVEKITSHNSKVLTVICEDATNGFEIWKTPALIALNALNTVALHAGSDAVQNHLIQENYLQCMIEMIKSDDAALSNLVEQTDAALLPLYIFEAKMSVFLGLAMNPEGAEILFSNRIFEVLGQCQFMKAQQQDHIFATTNVDSSLELTERYERLLIPTLKLIAAILCSFGGENDTVTQRAEGWVRRQQPVLANILKEERNKNASSDYVTMILEFIGQTKDFVLKGVKNY
ncbi:nucleoporin Nup186/Nup192/Nup205 [Pilaira anomala]|nr:nucleoporin Nup186/Nup192/Nup205 [Pilaira anomala]